MANFTWHYPGPRAAKTSESSCLRKRKTVVGHGTLCIQKFWWARRWVHVVRLPVASTHIPAGSRRFRSCRNNSGLINRIFWNFLDFLRSRLPELYNMPQSLLSPSPSTFLPRDLSPSVSLSLNICRPQFSSFARHLSPSIPSFTQHPAYPTTMAADNADVSARAELCGVMVVTAVTAAVGKPKTLYIAGGFYSGGTDSTLGVFRYFNKFDHVIEPDTRWLIHATVRPHSIHCFSRLNGILGCFV